MINIRAKLNSWVGDHWGFLPIGSKSGYMYRRQRNAPIGEYLTIYNHKDPVGMRVYLLSTIHDSPNSNLGGNDARWQIQLKYQKLGPSTSDELLYHHDSTEKGIEKCLIEIESDMENIGVPWLNKIAKGLLPNGLLRMAIDYVRNTEINADEEMIYADLRLKLIKAEGSYSVLEPKYLIPQCREL